jgi:6-phosphofructokinase 1
VSTKKNIAIVVGGGPAPGINGVIAAAAIEGINRGYKVLGIQRGFQQILKGDQSCIRELTIADVSRISSEGGSVLGTSRANPTKSPEMLATVVRCLKELNVGYLVTIGGDDTASSAGAVGQAAEGAIAVAHVPKTIDNDLPLPNKWSTFGFESAREVGTEIVETLMVDSKTTSRWYLVVAMGRKAGHLALGIGISSGATLTLIPEEFEGRKISLQTLADIIVGSMLKRLARNQPYGVVVLAEGLAEVLDQNSIPELADAERDPHGHIRFAEVDFGRIIKNAVRSRLHRFNIKDMLALDKNVGYELRCRGPNSFDREYTQQLGYGVIDFLLGGGTQAMISRQGDSLVPIPFTEMIDPASGRAKVRMVDTSTIAYRIARKYMIRLTEADVEDEELMDDISQLTKVPVSDIRAEFRGVVREHGAFVKE